LLFAARRTYNTAGPYKTGELMAGVTSEDGAVRLRCRCGAELRLSPQVLGRVFPCAHCGRYLRPALQFFLMERSIAPNLTALCTCGRFIVERVDRAGKVGRCKVCGRRVTLPLPVERSDGRRAVRVPRKALEAQLKRVRGRRQAAGTRGTISRLRRAGHRGLVSLRPGQEVCSNPRCSIPLPPGGNVCPRCGFNIRSGERYGGVGPERDPRGKWKRM